MRISDWSSDVCSSDLSIPLDEHGKALVKLPLNDSITQFQLVAVADFGPDRFGTGKASISSSQDLQAIEGLPALVREGDQYQRSEERRVGKECVGTCRSRWSTYH